MFNFLDETLGLFFDVILFVLELWEFLSPVDHSFVMLTFLYHLLLLIDILIHSP